MQKRNTILIILLLIVIIVLAYLALKPKSVTAPIAEENNKEVVKNETSLVKEYKNQELGFSFKYPKKYGEIKLTAGATSVISKGDIGKSFTGNIAWGTDGIFYFGGLTPDYTAGHGGSIGITSTKDCANITSYQGTSSIRRISMHGTKYAFFDVLDAGDINGNEHWYVAYFNLNKNNFPCLGFAAKADPITKEEFLKVTDSIDVD